MKLLKSFSLLTTALMLTVAVGCREAQEPRGHSHDSGHGHDHAPPHGGTPVVLAAHKLHLELVQDPGAGKLQAYVLDGHLEAPVAVPETSFVLVANHSGSSESLNFQRVPAATTGTATKKSALFEASSEWLKTTRAFEGNIPSITLNGTTYTNISFTFPKGATHDH
jgi:hypothetical protein